MIFDQRVQEALAGATFLLALTTVWMARETRRMAAESFRERMDALTSPLSIPRPTPDRKFYKPSTVGDLFPPEEFQVQGGPTGQFRPNNLSLSKLLVRVPLTLKNEGSSLLEVIFKPPRDGTWAKIYPHLAAFLSESSQGQVETLESIEVDAHSKQSIVVYLGKSAASWLVGDATPGVVSKASSVSIEIESRSPNLRGAIEHLELTVHAWPVAEAGNGLTWQLRDPDSTSVLASERHAPFAEVRMRSREYPNTPVRSIWSRARRAQGRK